MKDKSEAAKNQNELVSRVKQNDALAFVELLGEYSGIISSIARSFRLPQDEFDDLCQEGRIALYRAAVGYDGESASFSTYAGRCIKNGMLSWIKKLHFEREGVSLDETAAENFADSTNVHDEVAAKDTLEHVLDEKNRVLSSYEASVIVLKIAGGSIPKIAEKLGKSEKSVENTLFRARTKLKKYFGR